MSIFLRTLSAFSAGKIFGLSSAFGLAKIFGADAWGVVNVARSLMEVAQIVARGGAEQKVLKYSNNNSHDGIDVIRSSLFVTYVSMVVILLILYYVAPGNKVNPSILLLYLVAGLFLSEMQLKTVQESIYGGSKYLVNEQIYLQVSRFFVAIALFYVVSPEMALASSFIISVLTIHIYGRNKLPTYSSYSFKDLRGTVSLGSNYLLSAASSRVDLIVVSNALGMSSAGSYSISIAMSSLVTVIGSTQGRILAPIIAKSINTEVEEGVINQCKLRGEQTFIMGLIASSILIIGYKTLIYFLGPEYISNVFVFYLLSISSVIYFTFAYEGYWLSLSGNQRSERYVLLIYAFTLLILAVLLTSIYGMVGASTAVFCSSFMLVGLRKYAIKTVYSVAVFRGLEWSMKQLVTGSTVIILGIIISYLMTLLKSSMIETIVVVFILIIVQLWLTKNVFWNNDDLLFINRLYERYSSDL